MYVCVCVHACVHAHILVCVLQYVRIILEFIIVACTHCPSFFIFCISSFNLAIPTGDLDLSILRMCCRRLVYDDYEVINVPGNHLHYR